MDITAGEEPFLKTFTGKTTGFGRGEKKRGTSLENDLFGSLGKSLREYALLATRGNGKKRQLWAN